MTEYAPRTPRLRRSMIDNGAGVHSIFVRACVTAFTLLAFSSAAAAADPESTPPPPQPTPTDTTTEPTPVASPAATPEIREGWTPRGRATPFPTPAETPAPPTRGNNLYPLDDGTIWAPQADVWGGVTSRFHEGSVANVGAEFAMASVSPRPGQHMFLAEAFEGTLGESRGPYQWSAGAGTRIGMDWRWSHNHRASDTILYFKVLPFYAHGHEQFDPRERASGGVRIGVGASSLGWTRYGYQHFGEGNFQANNLANCLCLFTLDVLLPLINHVEVGTEIYGHEARDTEATAYARLGFGF